MVTTGRFTFRKPMAEYKKINQNRKDFGLVQLELDL